MFSYLSFFSFLLSFFLSFPPSFLSFIQTLLKNNITARVFRAQLADTDWTVEDISNFLSKQGDDQQPPGSTLTWRDVFNETDQAIMSISHFMEVGIQPRRATSCSWCAQIT